jgi:hypothetical protein
MLPTSAIECHSIVAIRRRLYQPVWEVGAKSFLGLEIGDGDLLKSCQPVPLCAIHGERLMNATPEERPPGRKTELALAIANGTFVAAWARSNQVSKESDGNNFPT